MTKQQKKTNSDWSAINTTETLWSLRVVVCKI